MQTQKQVVTAYCQNVVAELREMQKLGVRVPAKALKYAADPTNMADLAGNCRVSEAASLVLELVGV